MDIAVFPTCLAHNLNPRVEEATLSILSRLGHRAFLADPNGCCGQPAHSLGAVGQARAICSQWVKNQTAITADYLVIPSGSCTGMVRKHLARYLAEAEGLQSLLDKTFELSEFLVQVLELDDLDARFRGRVAYHPSCHLLRDLNIDEAPLRLLRKVKGIELVDVGRRDECCGFGGLFSVMFPEISASMASDKIERLVQSGAEAVVSADMGCLSHLSCTLARLNLDIPTLHLAEILDSPRSRGSNGKE